MPVPMVCFISLTCSIPVDEIRFSVLHDRGSSRLPEGSWVSGAGRREKEKPAPSTVGWPGLASASLLCGSSLPVYHTPGPSELWADPAGRVRAGCGVSWNSAVAFLRSYKSLFPNLKLPQPSSLSPRASCVWVSEGQLCLTGSEGTGRRPGLHMRLSALPGDPSARVSTLVDGDVPSGPACLLVHAGAMGRTPHTVLSPELESQMGCGEGRICLLLKVNNG